MRRAIMLTLLVLMAAQGAARGEDPRINRIDAIHEALWCRPHIDARDKPEGPCIDPRTSRIEIAELRFDRTKTDRLDPGSLPILEGLARFILAEPDLEVVEISVHLNEEEEPPRGWELSRRRAEAIYKVLQRHGVPSARIRTVGRAVSAPLGPKRRPDRYKNERVEVRILSLRGEFTTTVESESSCSSCPYSGECTPGPPDRWTCRAPTDEECRRSDECAALGRCVAVAKGCGPLTDADCTWSTACLERGDCVARRGRCRPASDAHCRLGIACRDYGECRWDGARCVR